MVLPVNKEQEYGFWKSIIEDEEKQDLFKIPTLIKTKIRYGIPSDLRREIWWLMAGASPDAFREM
jgi:hypothetical protein